LNNEIIGIEDSKRQLNKIRFTKDTPLASTSQGKIQNQIHSAQDAFFRDGLLIDRNTTPRLAEIVTEVCDLLNLPRDTVSCFVIASSEIQASCLSISRDKCIINFSSALINLLEEDEFYFVIGHELGHFLFDHSSLKTKENLEFFKLRRAQEISVDRVGLIACKSINHAARAIMKTASGLGSTHIKFDINQYISQASMISHVTKGENLYSTHPSMLLRCRALLWFSMIDNYRKYDTEETLKDLKVINERIEKELEKYVDGEFKSIKENLKSELSLWLAVKHVSNDGKFDEIEQILFSELFGKSTLNKVKKFLGSLKQSNFKEEIDMKIQSAKNKLEAEMPISFKREYKIIQDEIETHFKNHKK
tara:strand:- start:132 stop:1220 length:1089 start_codon:yes stop_codon:yes gene_type:complete